MKFKGLAEEYEGSRNQQDEVDAVNEQQDLDKKLLDHFRELAVTNQDSDQVTLTRYL